MSKITDLETIIVSVPAEGNAFAEGNEEVLLVRATDEDGCVGIGECIVTPRVLKSMIDTPTINFWSQGIKNIVVGADPIETIALYDRVYHGSFFHGRRGILIHALSAVDIAIHDLAAKQIGKPVYKLLGGARCEKILPYATLYPGNVYGGPLKELFSEVERQAKIASDQGLRAFKVPVLFGEHLSDSRLVPFIRDCRKMVGDQVELALDFGYRWTDWQDAAWLLKRIEEQNICFAEAPLLHDDLLGHARLAAVSPVRIGGAEFATGRWEVREWLETGQVSLVQPGVSRAGGFVELMRIAEMCEHYAAKLIPHSAASGISDFASFHLQAATRTVPMVETRSSRLGSSVLRRELVYPADPVISEGYISLPDEPGLGIELNQELIEKYALTQ